MRAVYGQNLFNFFPKTFILPNDYAKLMNGYSDMETWTQYIKERMHRSAKKSPPRPRSQSVSKSRTPISAVKDGKTQRKAKQPVEVEEVKEKEENNEKVKTTWIAKPALASQGRGIRILKDLAELKFETATVVQKYIENPMLISGYKFDLRLYVVIASYHPLTVYLYKVKHSSLNEKSAQNQ